MIATHNCCRALCDHDRQLDDRQIKALAERGGVIGTAFDDWMLSPLWDHEAADNTGITLGTVVDHIDHVCQVAGNARHAAIGTDLDGGYGKEQSPADMETIADPAAHPRVVGGSGVCGGGHRRDHARQLDPAVEGGVGVGDRIMRHPRRHGRPSVGAAPNILFLMTDQMQGRVLDPDHPCRTPNFDRLAAQRGAPAQGLHTERGLLTRPGQPDEPGSCPTPTAFSR